jgi:PmbA protein
MEYARKVNDWIRLCEKETHLAAASMPVIFTPRALDILLHTFLVNVSGKMVQKKASVLTERLGEKVLDERVTLIDDQMVDYAPGSHSVDAEGLPAATKPIFEDGVLRTFLFDLQTAGIMGAQPTGNAARGYASQPRPGPANIRMAPGVVPVKELYANVKRGLLIDQALGAGQSNVLAGEFSVNVELGFLIENGEIVARVKDCMLAGNAFDAFNNIRSISAETEWHGATELPTVCFESLSVTGKGG